MVIIDQRIIAQGCVTMKRQSKAVLMLLHYFVADSWLLQGLAEQIILVYFSALSHVFPLNHVDLCSFVLLGRPLCPRFKMNPSEFDLHVLLSWNLEANLGHFAQTAMNA